MKDTYSNISEITTLSALAEIRSGYQPKGAVINAPESRYSLITTKDIRENQNLVTSNLIRINRDRNLELYQVNLDDILILARGVNHTAYRIQQPLKDTLAGGMFYILSSIKTSLILPEYLTWWFNRPIVQRQLADQATKSQISFISIKVLSQFPVSVPPLDKQTKIIQLNRLYQKNQELTEKILTLQSQLVDTLCNKLILPQENTDEFQ